MRKIKTVKAFGVFFYAGCPDTMVVKDNNRVFKPLAIFPTRSEAVKWRKEKYIGNVLSRTETAPIREISLSF